MKSEYLLVNPGIEPEGINIGKEGIEKISALSRKFLEFLGEALRTLARRADEE